MRLFSSLFSGIQEALLVHDPSSGFENHHHQRKGEPHQHSKDINTRVENNHESHPVEDGKLQQEEQENLLLIRLLGQGASYQGRQSPEVERTPDRSSQKTKAKGHATRPSHEQEAHEGQDE